MLVLSRKMNEEIVIDGRITVRIVGLQGGRVRIGISAPQDVAVQRAELLQRDPGCEVLQCDPKAGAPLERNFEESGRPARLLCRTA